MKAVIFDLDGTLVDSMWIWESLAYDYLKEKGYKPNEDIGYELKQFKFSYALEYIKEKFNMTESLDVIAYDLNKIVDYHYREKFELKDDALEFLQYLKSKNMDMCVGTATEMKWARAVLSRHGIIDYFKFIENESSLGIKKNNPLFFKSVASRLEKPIEKVWMVEDSLYSIEAAKEAGCKIIAVHDNSARNDMESIKEKADIYVGRFSELKEDVLWRNY